MAVWGCNGKWWMVYCAAAALAPAAAFGDTSPRSEIRCLAGAIEIDQGVELEFGDGLPPSRLGAAIKNWIDTTNSSSATKGMRRSAIQDLFREVEAKLQAGKVSYEIRAQANASGVIHKTFVIKPDAEGALLNRFAEAMLSRFGTSIVYSPHFLKENSSAGLYNLQENQIFLSHESVDKLRPDLTVGHEIVHAKRTDHELAQESQLFSGEIASLDPAKPIVRGMDKAPYSTQFNRQELVAWAYSVRADATAYRNPRISPQERLTLLIETSNSLRILEGLARMERVTFEKALLQLESARSREQTGIPGNEPVLATFERVTIQPWPGFFLRFRVDDAIVRIPMSADHLAARDKLLAASSDYALNRRLVRSGARTINLQASLERLERARLAVHDTLAAQFKTNVAHARAIERAATLPKSSFVSPGRVIEIAQAAATKVSSILANEHAP